MNGKKIALLWAMLFFLITVSVHTETNNNDSDDGDGFSFSMAMEIGAQTFNEATGPETYQMLALYPDFEIGKFGVGLAIVLNYRFDPDFTIREEDWVVDADKNFLDLYLPIFRYVRYGRKGDFLYAKFGSITDGTLGNGFIMGNYANTMLLPERRILGFAFDLDGALFNFPYLGMETFVGNIAQFDVLGARLFTRPLYGLELPLLSDLQIGATVAADREPNALYDFYEPGQDEGDSPVELKDVKSVPISGIDFRQPILTENPLTLALFGDLAFQTGGDETNIGSMVGLGGHFLGFINYGLNALFLGDNFVPFYFNTTYDLYRNQNYLVYSGNAKVDAYAGWLTSMGFSLLGDTLIFNTSLGGAFERQEGNESTYPYLQAQLIVAEGLIPGIFFDAGYNKRNIESFEDIISPEDAVIYANLNYRSGPAVITLGYNLRYNPEPIEGEDEWEVTAKLSTSISF